MGVFSPSYSLQRLSQYRYDSQYLAQACERQLVSRIEDSSVFQLLTVAETLGKSLRVCFNPNSAIPTLIC